MATCTPFDVISDAVDLDSLEEHANAQRFMVNALGRVTECLPVAAQAAAATAKQYLTGTATAGDVLAMRVKLWKAIKGRDQSGDPDVLRIRATICALYGMDVEAPYDALDYFLDFWEMGGLSMVALEGAILDVYGVVYRACVVP